MHEMCQNRAAFICQLPRIFSSVLKKHAAKRYREVPPNCADFNSSNLKGLDEFISDKPQLKKARKSFFNTLLRYQAVLLFLFKMVI